MSDQGLKKDKTIIPGADEFPVQEESRREKSGSEKLRVVSSSEPEEEHPVEENQCGDALLQTVVGLTGLPETLVRRELEKFLATRGTGSKSLTLDELRQVMLAYLESVQDDLQADAEEPTSLH